MSFGERYLARLGVARPETLDLAALTTLLEAHLRTVPFENVTSFLGTPVSLDPEQVFAKLIDSGRGGYCMEHALVSRTALGDLGFDVEPLAARVVLMETDVSAQTHGMTAVRIGEKRYIYDTGFGGMTPSIPLLLGTSEEQVGKYGKYRVRPVSEAVGDTVEAKLVGPDVTHIYETIMADKWAPMYGLTPGPVIPADVDAFNWWLSTSPASLFTTHLLCARWDGENRVTGFDRGFKKRTGENVEECKLSSEADVDRWLRKEMGLKISDEQVAKLWEKLSTFP